MLSAPQMENAGLQPGVIRNQLGGWLHSPSTASDRQAQMLAARFCLSPWMAQDMARLCFGECGHE
ncbi:hypothetical protein C0V78_09535 [Novosphingobium sp. TH158]|nr:hypothetical protein C0V78_09535 [Novosphingobium sp. TH158]